jgi:hypothetical protein
MPPPRSTSTCGCPTAPPGQNVQGVLDEVLLAVRDRTEQYANNHIECNHGRLRRGCDRCAGSSGTAVPEWSAPAHAFVQSIRRGHYEPVVEVPANRRMAVAFDGLVMTISTTTVIAASAGPRYPAATAPVTISEGLFTKSPEHPREASKAYRTYGLRIRTESSSH